MGKYFEKRQIVWFLVGLAMAVVGGLMKGLDVSQEPGVFEYVFFRGYDYILMVSGFVLIILALGYDLLFEPSDDG